MYFKNTDVYLYHIGICYEFAKIIYVHSCDFDQKLFKHANNPQSFVHVKHYEQLDVGLFKDNLTIVSSLYASDINCAK